jgi:Ca-activated chloride channel homolog
MNRTYLCCIALFFCATGVLSAQAQITSNPPETISIRVSVWDRQNRPVINLQKENFEIYEDKVEQEINQFSRQTAPLSAGLVLDVSASMKYDKSLDEIKKPIIRFLNKEKNGNDEYFLAAFNEHAKLVQKFGGKDGASFSEADFPKAGGLTAIYDAIYMSLDVLKSSKNANKALILITDGEDSQSQYSASQVQDLAMEMNVPIYAICRAGGMSADSSKLRKVVSLAGGRTYSPANFSEAGFYIDMIRSELHNQYVLSYLPSNNKHDGKWRKLSIKLKPLPALRNLIIRSREGRYAPKE